jgi:ribonuclease Z
MPKTPAAGITARIVFVGTGGGAHVERAHECIALQFAPDDVMLLDTAGGFEIVRHLKHAGIDLGAIHSVFVSHRHSDHIGGLEPLLLHVGLHALANGPRKKDLAVYAHPEVIRAGQALLESMVSFAPPLFDMTGEKLRWVPVTTGKRVTMRRGLYLTPFTVDHEPPGDTCQGCRVDFRQGGRSWSVVYSGDTRPAPGLDAHAQGADVLLHEASGLDSNADKVHTTGHSTAGDAARLAAKAGVRRLFLTHLPNDQLLQPALAEARRYYDGPASIPYDLDSLALADLLDAEPDAP